MKEIIETSKCRFAVCEILNNAVFGLKFNYYGEDKYEAMFDNSENNFSYEKCYKLSEITEEEASSIVDYPILLEEIQGGDKMYTYYNYKIGRYDYGSSLVDSLESLLESQGIETTQNTYIFKV